MNYDMKKRKLVFATNNANKINEVKALLEACGPEVSERYEVLSLRDIGCNEDIPENSNTFAGNALQKAEYVNVHYDVDCFADDSGLEVRALGMWTKASTTTARPTTTNCCASCNASGTARHNSEQSSYC